MDFKKSLNFEGKIKAFNVFAKKDKNNNPYLMGQMTHNISVLIQKNTSQYAKEGEYNVFFIPIKYEKISQEKEPAPSQEAGF